MFSVVRTGLWMGDGGGGLDYQCNVNICTFSDFLHSMKASRFIHQHKDTGELERLSR